MSRRHCRGAIKDHTQFKIRIEGEEHWTKRDKNSGQFIDQKADAKNSRTSAKSSSDAGGCTR